MSQNEEDKQPKIIVPASAIDETLTKFFEATRDFAREFSAVPHNNLKGKSDGKAVGTYIEHAFQDYLAEHGVVRREEIGSSAKGIDLPTLGIDIKVTSIRQPQSSCPFRSYKQKIEGLGYNLVLFVYEKTDTETDCFLPILAARYIPKERTADYGMTTRIQEIIKDGGNAEDIFAYLVDRMLPADEVTLLQYAQWLLKNPPLTGYLTISNALQWRLQYNRVITSILAGVVNLDPPGGNDLSVAGLQEALLISPEDSED